MFDTFMREWGLPVFGIVFAIGAYFYAWYSARQFDRKYGPHDPARGG